MTKTEEKTIDIVAFIPFGKKNAISRHALAERTGLSDRNMRNLINQARKRAVIINVQDGNGYFRPTKEDVDEVVKFKQQEESRAKKVFASLIPVRRFLRSV